jgi:hypothetical protein
MASDADAWIRLLAEHPNLIQRPLALTLDGRACTARDDETLPMERVIEIVLTAAHGRGITPP